MSKRIFLIVLDSVGIGELPDADKYGDKDSNTIRSCATSSKLNVPTLEKMGLFNIVSDDWAKKFQTSSPSASFGKINEASSGKDTTIGHWEINGIISEKPLPTYPNGFPEEVIKKFEKLTGKRAICNKPYSGTQVLTDYGKDHVDTGDLIVYTSADSVFQIAAHEDIVPIKELYVFCQIARDILTDEHGVGRVIARPFIGEYPNFTRTSNRRDFSLKPPKDTVLDCLMNNGLSTIGVGKIYDIFAGKGISQKFKTKNNDDGMDKTIEIAKDDFNGLCFVNLVDFDMVFGHRNNVDGYANALTEFDAKLKEFLPLLRQDDLLIITADHGCDPGTESTDHSREYVPLLVYGDKIKQGVNLGTLKTFSDIGASIAEYFNIEDCYNKNGGGSSFLKNITI